MSLSWTFPFLCIMLHSSSSGLLWKQWCSTFFFSSVDMRSGLVVLNNYLYWFSCLDILIYIAIFQSLVSIIIELHTKFKSCKWRFKYISSYRRLPGKFVPFLYYMFLINKMNLFSCNLYPLLCRSSLLGTAAANYMGFENERKWWLSTSNLWFCWGYLVCCLQFFNWKYCSCWGWPDCDHLWSSQVGRH